MKVNARFTTALWIGLVWAGSASPSLASSTDVATPVLAAAPQSRPDFSGHWVLNAKASDDPVEKAKEAMKQAKGGGQGRGGMGGMGGGMGGGRQGRGSPEGMRGRSEPSPEMSALIASAEKLDITHEDPMLLVSDENDRRQRVFTDFRSASVSASGGMQQRVAVADWEGAALVVETTMSNGSKLVQNYQIDAKTGQLMISTSANRPEMPLVSYRLVYDRLRPEADAGVR